MKCPNCDQENPADQDRCTVCEAVLDPAAIQNGTVEAATQQTTVATAAGEATRARSFSLIGSVVGQCEIVEEIGGGISGRVYKARQLDAGGRIVAIKVCRERAGGDPTQVLRFVQEAKIGGSLMTPFVVEVIRSGFDEDVGSHYIVMKYVEGGLTLGKYARTLPHRRIPEPEAMALLLQCCRAMQVAEANKVVHRDLKPENILLQRRVSVEDGSVTAEIRYDARVGDFGAARIDGESLTIGTGQMMTVAYASPEQLQLERATSKSDMYCLGATFSHMLTGVCASANRGEQIAGWVRAQPFLSPREYWSGVSAKAEAIIRRMTAQAPATRYATFADLVRDIEAYFRDETVTRRLRRPLPRWVTPSGIVVVAGALVWLLTLLVGVPPIKVPPGPEPLDLTEWQRLQQRLRDHEAQREPVEQWRALLGRWQAEGAARQLRGGALAILQQHQEALGRLLAVRVDPILLSKPTTPTELQSRVDGLQSSLRSVDAVQWPQRSVVSPALALFCANVAERWLRRCRAALVDPAVQAGSRFDAWRRREQLRRQFESPVLRWLAGFADSTAREREQLVAETTEPFAKDWHALSERLAAAGQAASCESMLGAPWAARGDCVPEVRRLAMPANWGEEEAWRLVAGPLEGWLRGEAEARWQEVEAQLARVERATVVREDGVEWVQVFAIKEKAVAMVAVIDIASRCLFFADADPVTMDRTHDPKDFAKAQRWRAPRESTPEVVACLVKLQGALDLVGKTEKQVLTLRQYALLSQRDQDLAEAPADLGRQQGHPTLVRMARRAGMRGIADGCYSLCADTGVEAAEYWIHGKSVWSPEALDPQAGLVDPVKGKQFTMERLARDGLFIQVRLTLPVFDG